MRLFAVLLLLLLLMVGRGAPAQQDGAPSGHLEWKFPPELYGQLVELHFRTPEAAAAAQVSLCPLFEGYERAVSCRYDDNQPGNLKAKEIFDERGVKATWYLNSDGVAYHNAGPFRETAAKLIENGHTIGGHSLSHPYISYVHRNRMFQEVAGIRIEWESELDTLIHSYAFSFVDWNSPAEGMIVQSDLIQCLERAGYYHTATFKHFHDILPSDLLQSIIMPPENQSFEDFKKAVDWAVNTPELKDYFPCISHSMHAWYDSVFLDFGWDELERRVDYLNQFPFWQCSQNQFAAYWYQSRHGKVSIAPAEGKVVRVFIERPSMTFLNDPIPLSLAVRGVAREDLEKAHCATAAVTPGARQEPGAFMLNVHHDHAHALPRKIGRVENRNNAGVLGDGHEDADFPGLRALLHFDGETLRLQLDNQGDAEISDVRATYRLPLGWAEGIETHRRHHLPMGAMWQDQWAPTKEAPGSKHHQGIAYFVAQIDFRHGDVPARLYATCEYDNGVDASFPRGRFAVLGPIGAGEFQVDALAAAVQGGAMPGPSWMLPSGIPVYWRANPLDGVIPEDYIEVEVVRTRGSWFDMHSHAYVLWTKVTSPDDRAVKVDCMREDVKKLFVNGEEIAGMDARLRAGENDLVVFYHFGQVTGSPRHVGCFLRLAHPDSGVRMADLRYALPPLAF